MSNEKTIALAGKAIGNEYVEVTLEEFRRVAALPLVEAALAAVPSVYVERGVSVRGLCGVRVSMGGLRLPKQIVVRAEDTFVFQYLHIEATPDPLTGKDVPCLMKIKPEDLVPVSIIDGNLVHSHDNYNVNLFGFKVPKSINDHTALKLEHNWGTHTSGFLLGDVQDAMVLDEDDKAAFKWVVLEPLVVPSPKSRFPSSEGTK